MFDVEVCEPKRVVLIRSRGELAAADFTALDAMGREMQEGPGQSLDHRAVGRLTAVSVPCHS
jgi:hypothetical protein